MQRKTPLALHPLQPIAFLDWILDHAQTGTIIVICLEREVFLESLQDNIAPIDGEGSTQADTKLLTPRLRLIAISQSIRMVFTPSIPHLRAFLSTLASKEKLGSTDDRASRSKIPFLAIWGLATLHRSTIEQSAQGISRSLAVAVHTADSQASQLLLAEPKRLEVYDRKSGDEESEPVVLDPWREQIPLLSGSIRFGGDERGWLGKTIEVGVVVQKWCRFVVLDDVDESCQGDCEG